MRTAAAALAASLLAALPAAAAKPAKPESARKRADTAAVKEAPLAASGGVEFPVYPPSTAPVTLALVAERFAETDARLQSLRASFRQFVRMDGSDTVQTVEGEVLFRRPDLMRLTHRVPEPQTVVSDGAWLWVWRESTNQVIQTRLSAWRKSEPLARGLLDFGRSADLLTRYDARLSTVSAPGADGHRTFELVLKPKEGEKGSEEDDFTLALKVSTRDFFPADATLRVGRASIHSVFENVRLNPQLPDDAFRFTPPADADVFKSQEKDP